MTRFPTCENKRRSQINLFKSAHGGSSLEARNFPPQPLKALAKYYGKAPWNFKLKAFFAPGLVICGECFLNI